jgi:hypothetical protein
MSLQEVMKSNHLAEAVFKALAMRDRFRQVTDLRRLYNDVDKITHGNATPEEFNEVVKNMERAGLGKFVAGRKNNPDRFKWATKGVAKAIKEGRVDEIKPREKAVKPVETPMVFEPQAPQFTDLTPPVHEAAPPVEKETAVTYINVRIPLNIPLDSLQQFIENIKRLQNL